MYVHNNERLKCKINQVFDAFGFTLNSKVFHDFQFLYIYETDFLFTLFLMQNILGLHT